MFNVWQASACAGSQCFRWVSSIVPLGVILTPSIAVAHAASRDDEYKGHLIPKGSIVMGNTW